MEKKCWNCGIDLPANSTGCGRCGRLQSTEMIVVLRPKDQIRVCFSESLHGLALIVNDRMILPASSWGIRIQLQRE